MTKPVLQMNALFSRLRRRPFQFTSLIAIFILLVCTLSAHPQARKPLTADEISELLKSGVSTNRLVQLVESYGVAFELDDRTLRRLKENGATSEVLSSVKKMSVRFAEEKKEDAVSEKSLQVEIWTDKGPNAIYSEGEKIVIKVRVNRDAFVRVYYTDAGNQTYRIFPNVYRQQARLRAGTVLTIPDVNDPLSLEVTGPFGVESITVLAGETPLKKPDEKGSPVGPYLRVSGVPQEGGNMVKGQVTLTTRAKL